MSEPDESKTMADYLIDCVLVGLDKEYVKVVCDAVGDPIFSTERPGLCTFRVVCDREGEECCVEVTVGSIPPGRFRL